MNSILAEPGRFSVKQRLGRAIIRRLPVTRFLFDQLRCELNAQLLRAKYRILPHYIFRLRKLRLQRNIYVNVACGPDALDDFVNLDLFCSVSNVVPWDRRWSLPLSAESAAGIRVEHFVEHLETREELPSFLRSCWKALKQDGVLRIIVPDAEQFLRSYCQDGRDGFDCLDVPDPFPSDLPTRMDVVNHVFHQWHEHRWGYDFDTLKHRLHAAGFKRIERKDFGDSLNPFLAKDNKHHAPYSLYVDAVKL